MMNRALGWISYGTLIAVIWGSASCGNSKSKLAPTINLSASTNALNTGQSVTLNWQAANATAVTITATAGSSTRTLVSGTQLSGTVQDSPTATTTYTAMASGPGGNSPPQSTTVQVA